jgi:hypothetical protein
MWTSRKIPPHFLQKTALDQLRRPPSVVEWCSQEHITWSNLEHLMEDKQQNLAAAYSALCAPFPPEVVELKPGAVSEEKKRALALAYVDARYYQSRLDSVVGPSNWQVAYRPWGERGVICSLTVFGVTREDVGEAETGDPNQATSAAMQSFKRACAAFGLGRYLYTDLPQMWVDAEQRGRTWVIANAPGTVREMYAQAGITLGKRGQYIQRIHTLLNDLSEEELVGVGKQIASTHKKAA